MRDLNPGFIVTELAELTGQIAERAAPQSGPAASLRETMVFFFKTSVRAADGKLGCTWGDTVVITANGGQRLGKGGQTSASQQPVEQPREGPCVCITPPPHDRSPARSQACLVRRLKISIHIPHLSVRSAASQKIGYTGIVGHDFSQIQGLCYRSSYGT